MNLAHRCGGSSAIQLSHPIHGLQWVENANAAIQPESPSTSSFAARRPLPGKVGITACLEAALEAARLRLIPTRAHGSVPGISAGYLRARSRQLVRLMP